MKTLSVQLFITVVLGCAVLNGSAQTRPGKDENEITQVLSSYGNALNSGDAKYAASLYSADCVVMPPDGPTVQGRETVRNLYAGLFKDVSIRLSFHVDEVVVSNNLAYVRSTSKGTIRLLKAKKVIPEGNRELFIFKKENGSWKISRYLFNLNK